MHNLVPRPTKVIFWEDQKIGSIDTTLLVIKFRSGSVTRHRLDIGSLCYTRRVISSKTRSYHVDISSLRKDRISALRALAEFLLKQCSSASAYAYFSRIVFLFNYIDSKSIDVDFNKHTQLIDLYFEITNHLIDRMSQPALSGLRLSKLYASSVQIRIAEYIALLTNKHTVEIQGTCTLITQSGKSSANTMPAPFDDQKRCIAVHLEIFRSISDHLMSFQGLPINMQADGTTVNYYSQIEPTCSISKLARDTKLLTWDEVLERARNDKIPLGPKSRNTYQELNSKIKKYNEDKTLNYRKLNLANKAIAAFFLAFLSATTANESSGFGIRLPDKSDVPEALPSPVKGMRYIHLKARAGNKIISFEFGVRFRPYYDSYIKFREWLLKELGWESVLLFFYINHHAIKNTYPTQLTSSKISDYKIFYTKYFPRSPWISSAKLRRGGANYFLSKSNSPIITSQKLGNTPETVLTNYLDTSFEQASHEIGTFLNKMYQFAILRTRTTDTQIPVSINDSEGRNTATAHCSSNDEAPLLADGFNSLAPQPDCGTPNTCLFCKYFLVHADHEDIRKLLSLEDILLRMQSKPLNHDHFNDSLGVTLHRIQEILLQIQESIPDSKSIINNIRIEVSNGKLDSFWGIHFDLLVELGYIE